MTAMIGLIAGGGLGRGLILWLCCLPELGLQACDSNTIPALLLHAKYHEIEASQVHVVSKYRVLIIGTLRYKVLF